MPLSTVFQSYHGDSSHYSCLSCVSPVLGWGFEASCPRTLPRKNPEDPVPLEPRTPGLRVKHFTTEPRKTPIIKKESAYDEMVENTVRIDQHFHLFPVFFFAFNPYSQGSIKDRII